MDNFYCYLQSGESVVEMIPEVVDNSNGTLVTPGDDNQIYDAIRKYVDNKQLLTEQGKESFKKVETYLPDYVLNHLKMIYENLLKEE